MVSIRNLFLRLLSTLSVRRKWQLGAIFLLMILGGALEIISLGMVVPFLISAAHPEKILENSELGGLLDFCYAFLGQDPPQNFLARRLLVPLLALAFGLAVIVSTSVRALLLWASTEFAGRAGTDLSCEAYHRKLFQPYQLHTSSNSSHLIAALVSKIPMIVTTFSSLLTLITSLVFCICIFIALVVIDTQLALLSAAILGCVYFGVAWISRHKIAQTSRIIAREQGQMVKALQEGLGGIRDVILDHSQSFYCALYRSAETRLRRARSKAALLSSMPKVWVEATALLFFASVVGFLGFSEKGLVGALPILGALALGAQRLLPSIQQGYASWTYIQAARSSIVDVLEMLELPVDPSILQDAVEPLPLHDSIRFQNVKFRYTAETPWIFHGFSFTIRKGSRVGFVGKTGTGKSTCLDLLMGLLEPTQGAIFVDQTALAKENLQAWRRNIAHVPQSIFLVDSTFTENIAFGVPFETINMRRVKEAAEQAQISQFIENSSNGYQTTVGERGVRLSGGQRQRIGIARALYKQAQVLVFDEATSALDHETESAVMESINSLSRELTILIIAHRTSTLKDCDQIIDLDLVEESKSETKLFKDN